MRRVNLPSAALAWTVTLTGAIGCARHSASNDRPAVERVPVELTIDNHSVADLTVFVVHDGRTDRLDRIEGARKKVIRIPVRMIGVLGDLRLIGERAGAHAGFAGRILTESVTPRACQHLEWSIEAQLEQSTLGVFPTPACSS